MSSLVDHGLYARKLFSTFGLHPQCTGLSKSKRSGRWNYPRATIISNFHLPTHSVGVKSRTSQSLRLITAIKTHYLPDGRFDLEAYDSLIQMQIDNGVESVVVGGTTGEGHLMSWDEHIMLIAHTIACFGSSLKVIGNTGSNSTREAVPATEQDRIKYYVANGSAIWSGNDDDCHDARWENGATGVISVASNLVPGLMHELMFKAANPSLSTKLMALFDWLYTEPNLIGLNTALAQLGVIRPIFKAALCSSSHRKKNEFH